MAETPWGKCRLMQREKATGYRRQRGHSDTWVGMRRVRECCEVHVITEMGNNSSALRLLENTQICCTAQPQKQVEVSFAREEEPSSTKSQAEPQSPRTTAELDIKGEDRLQRIEEAVHYAKLLILRVVTSKVLPTNKEVVINAQGVEGSRRDAKDGVVYFGNKLKGGGEYVNDVKLPASDKELSAKHRGRHFQIAYDPYSDKYYIKDLSVGFGAFVKLVSPLVLKDNHLVHIGESFVVVNLMRSGPQRCQPRLRLKLFGGPCTGEVFFFNANEYRNSAIRIGRMFTCEIQVEDSLISKFQCALSFDPDRGWVLTDGDATGRSSTNGTWYILRRLYLSENTQIYDGMLFKANQTVFSVSLVYVSCQCSQSFQWNNMKGVIYACLPCFSSAGRKEATQQVAKGQSEENQQRLKPAESARDPTSARFSKKAREQSLSRYVFPRSKYD